MDSLLCSALTYTWGSTVNRYRTILLFSILLLLASCTPVLPGAEPNDGTPLETSKPMPDPLDTPPVLEQRPADRSLLSSQEPPPRGAEREFATDFGRHTVSYAEVLSGGPPKDGIPAIDQPQFVSIQEADVWLEANEPVVLVEIGDEARVYPIQILMWHEIVNDTLGGVPIAVTFCPLCNTAIAFERLVGDSQETTFGTTGRLRYSNLIMYDRLTETWWQQATGEGLAGEHAGATLKTVPATIVAWESFQAVHPDGDVLSRETGFSRSYGVNPYRGYDDVNESPFLFRGPPTPGELPAMARVLTVDRGEEAVAYPFEELAQERVVNDTVADLPVVVFWQEGTASALDSGVIAEGRDVGAASAFSRVLDGQTLSFHLDGESFVDEQTGSEWTVLGRATSGPLSGRELTPVVSINHFWFSWAAFRPETRIYTC